MQIKYVGPRPFINQHGIEFLTGKEDKYVYLNIAIQILIAIDHQYTEEHKSYSYHPATKRLSDKEMLEIMLSYDPSLEEKAKIEEIRYEEKIAQEIEKVKHRENISDIEKEVWINNLEIMKPYRIQRAINKIYYMHAIEEIKEIIIKKHIKEIDTPFYEKFFHVLETIRGALEGDIRHSYPTDLKVETMPDGNLIAKLYIQR